MRVFVLGLCLLFLISCSKNKVLVEPIVNESKVSPFSSKSFSVVGDYHSFWPKDWTTLIFSALEDQSSALLDNDLDHRDLELLNCSNFNTFSKEHKKMFWALFMASISHFESSFNPRERYWEKSMSKYSEGLFQLSTTDSRYYSYCDVDEFNILLPEENIRCAVNILDIQVEGSSIREPGRLFPKSYFYWSVLTRESSKNKVQKFFRSRAPELLPFCV